MTTSYRIPIRMSLSLCVELFELLISAFRQLTWPCCRIRLQTFSSRFVTGALQRTLKSGEITTASLFAGKHIGMNEKYTLNILEHWIQWRDGQYGEWWSHGFLWQREHGFSSPCAGRSIFHKNSSLIKKSSSWIMVQQVVTWYSKPVIFNTPQAHEYWLRLVHADTVVNAPLAYKPDIESVVCSGTMVEICRELGHQHALNGLDFVG